MITEQTRNYLIIGSIVIILFMFMQGTNNRMAVGDTSAWEELGQNFLQTIQDLFSAIVSNKFLVGLIAIIVIGIIIFGSKRL